MATRASIQRAVFYRSPSGLLYSTARAVLAHMRSEGSYTRDQVKQFRVEMNRWQDYRGQVKEGREGWQEKQATKHTSEDPQANENMKKEIMDALSGEMSKVYKKQKNTSKASELENVLKSLKAKKTKSSKRKTEGKESVVRNTGLERKRVKMSLNVPYEKVDQELEQKQSSPFVFSSPSQCDPLLLDILPVDKTADQFQCDMCQREYSHKRTMLMHVKIKHRENDTFKNDIAINVAPPKRGHGQKKNKTIEDAKIRFPKNAHKETSSLALKRESDSPMPQSLPKRLNGNSSLPLIGIKDSGLPKGWSLRSDAGRQVYREPGSRQLEGRVQALAHMLEKGSAPEEMFQLWSSLGEEGWVVENSLPTGWRKRTTEDGNVEFLSPMMEVFAKEEAFLKFVLSEGV